jgi:hypothetical protein
VTPPGARALYGLHLTGVAGPGLLHCPEAGWPRVAVRHTPEPAGPEPLPAASDPGPASATTPARRAEVGPERAAVDLPGRRRILLRRSAGTATFTGPPASHDELVHPYLGVAASVFGRWAGREVFHAGAFVSGRLAWAVVGGREAGKSSLLAVMAARGVPILADDLVITDGHLVFAGPRTVDLRHPPPGYAAPLTSARGGTRWRLALPALPSSMPLGGWIYLTWHAEVAMRPVPASEGLARLAVRRVWPELPSQPETLLALAAHPTWDLGRPADWARMDESVDLILGTLRGAGRPQLPGARSTSAAVRHPSRKRATSASAAAGGSPNAAARTPASSAVVAPSASRSQRSAPEALSAW